MTTAASSTSPATGSVEPVRATVTVEAPAERAFDVFTRRFDAWWPRTHKLGAGDLAEGVLEPWGGGRWYERDTDGCECESVRPLWRRGGRGPRLHRLRGRHGRRCASWASLVSVQPPLGYPLTVPPMTGFRFSSFSW